MQDIYFNIYIQDKRKDAPRKENFVAWLHYVNSNKGLNTLKNNTRRIIFLTITFTSLKLLLFSYTCRGKLIHLTWIISLQQKYENKINKNSKQLGRNPSIQAEERALRFINKKNKSFPINDFQKWHKSKQQKQKILEKLDIINNVSIYNFGYIIVPSYN